MALLRGHAVNFQEKWAGLKDTIGRVVRLQTVDMSKWNDHYSYPPLPPSSFLFLNLSDH